MSGIIGSKFNHRGSGLVGSLGTDGQHLLSSGAGVSNVFETVAAGADVVKIASASASGSATTIDVDNCFDDTTYAFYMVRWDGIVLSESGGDPVHFRLLDASGSAITTSKYISAMAYHYYGTGSSSGNALRIATGEIAYVDLLAGNINYYTDADPYYVFEGVMWLNGVQNTSYRPQGQWICNCDNAAGSSFYWNSGTFNYSGDAIAHRGISFFSNGGYTLLNTGKVAVYGYKM